MEHLSIQQLEAQLAMRFQNMEQERISMAQAQAKERAEHFANLEKERAEHAAILKATEDKFAKQKEEQIQAAALAKKEEDTLRVMRERAHNEQDEEARKVHERISILKKRLDELEIAEDKARKAVSDRFYTNTEEVPQMSSHLNKLLRLADRDTIGIERP